MKETNKVSKMPVFGLAVTAAIVLSAALLLTGCIWNLLDNDDDDDGDGSDFTSVDAFGEWLGKQPENTPETSYRVKLNLNTLDGSWGKNIGDILRSTWNRYVYLDLSGSTIKTIPAYAFAYPTIWAYCPTLTGITIPASVTSIGYQGLAGTGITTLTIPNSVTTIEKNAFQECTSLTSITIPNSVTSIGNSAFSGCTSLTSVTIPNSVTSMDTFNAFSGCTSLKSVTIPDSVTEIGQSAFEKCSSLTSVNIPNGVTSIGNRAFDGCASLTSVNIPNGVTGIDSWAFQSCASLTSITIPSSVTYIRWYAFSGCTSLTSVTFECTITDFNLSPFDYDLLDKYLAGGIGTYTRESGGGTWTKQ